MLALSLLIAAGVPAVGGTADAQDAIVVAPPTTLSSDVGVVRAVSSEGARHGVLSSSAFRTDWSLRLASGGVVSHTELDGPSSVLGRPVIAVGDGGAAVGWVSDGSLAVELVRPGGGGGSVVRVADADDRVIEAAIAPFGDRFVAAWVEAEGGDTGRLRVMSRTIGPDGSLGTVRLLDGVEFGRAVGGLHLRWHDGRGEALAMWFAGPPGEEVPIRSRRILSESELGSTQSRSDVGMASFPPGDPWLIRVQLVVHGPTEWLIEARTYDCSLPCDADRSQLTFATHGTTIGFPFDGGFGDRPHWERSQLAGSPDGPTLLIEQPGHRSTEPAEIWELPWQTIEWFERDGVVPLPDGTTTFHVDSVGDDHWVLAQATGAAARLTAVSFTGFTPTRLPAPITPDAPTIAPPSAPSQPETGSGYWLVDTAGDVHAFGGAVDLGGVTAANIGGAEIVDIESTRSGLGYWILLSDQRILALGDAQELHTGSALLAGERAASISAHPIADGYWIATDRGRILAYGAAQNLGDLGSLRLNAGVLDSVATPTGNGYWLIAADGGVFAFGDAEFHGSMGGVPLNLPVVGLAPTASGAGYWLVAADGGVFAFGDARFHGSMGGVPLVRPVNGMVATGDGYLMVASDGGVFAFGDAEFRGSIGGAPRAAPIVALAPRPSTD